VGERIHRKLELWQRSVDLSFHIYQVSRKFPLECRFGLTSQILKTCVSISSNIAEGAARDSKKEKLRFFNIAQGSLSELDTQVEIAKRCAFMADNEYRQLIKQIEIISKQLYKLIGWVKSKTTWNF
jgi:four helix bundle protein